MITLLHITLISGFTLAMIMLLLIIIICKKKFSKPSTIDAERCDEAENGEASFLQHDQGVEEKARSNKKSCPPLFRQRNNKPFFSWSDHPCLVAHAVEHGWPTFSFAPSPSLNHSTNFHSKGVLAADDHGSVEISWEVFEESVDYMQKIRVKESTLCVIRAGLPLPGPQFANASFPKEAYFEIKFLHNNQEMDHDHLGDDKGKIGSETTSKHIEDHVDETSKGNKIEELKDGEKQESEDEMILVAIGLSRGEESNAPLEVPGSFVGSVGFNSSGAVYLDGMKLVRESENEAGWGRAGSVIGCGYNPGQRKVFFTVNSQLVYEIRCKTEEFCHPLYPTLAANSDVTVVVNLGQSPFKFEAANSQRTSNPCFISTRASCAPNYELDSKELFSMGVIDGKWKHRSDAKSSETTISGDLTSEADLFEIVAR